jgi:hypothetical protein
MLKHLASNTTKLASSKHETALLENEGGILEEVQDLEEDNKILAELNELFRSGEIQSPQEAIDFLESAADETDDYLDSTDEPDGTSAGEHTPVPAFYKVPGENFLLAHFKDLKTEFQVRTSSLELRYTDS